MNEWLVLMLGSALGYRGVEPITAVAITAMLLVFFAGRRNVAGPGASITLALVTANAALFGAASYLLGRGIALILAA